MAWNDHPQGHKGYFWMHNPTAVFQAQLDYTSTVASGKLSGEDIYQYLYVSSITLGALADLKPDMTLSLGSAAGGWDLGFCRVAGVVNVSGTDVIRVWIGGATEKAGDLHIATGTKYITVWNEFRLWAKPPYYDDNGSGYFDGQLSNGVGGINYNHWPVANGGPPVMGLATDGVLSVDFSARKSYRVEHTAALGSWLDTTANAIVSASSENGGNVANNVKDGNTGTYWEPSGALSQELTFQYVSGGASHPLYRVDITASGTHAPKYIIISVGGDIRGYGDLYTWLADFTNETGWGTHETRSFYIDVDHDNEVYGTNLGLNPLGYLHLIYQITFLEANGGTLQIEEVKLYEEQRTGGATEAFTWDFADGTIITGTVNSEAPTVTFPPGFRYVSLTVEDSNGYTDVHWIPVLVLGTSYTYAEISYSGATFADSSHVGASTTAAKMFDNVNSTVWEFVNINLPAWGSAALTASKTIAQYQIRAASSGASTTGPKAWQLQAKIGGTWVAVDTQSNQTAWTNGEIRTFTLTTPITATEWRLYVTQGNGTTLQDTAISELNLKEPVVDAQELPLAGVEVRSRELTLGGQSLDVVFHEDISAYPEGALVMFGQTEYFAGAELDYDAAIVTVSAEAEPIPGTNAFDNDQKTYWGTGRGFSSEEWIKLEFPAAVLVDRYSLTQADSYSNQASPAAWVLEYGSNGSSWSTADTQTGITWAEGVVTKTYTLSTPQTAKYWRLRVTAINGGEELTLAEFGLYREAITGSVPEAEHELVDRAFLKFWGWVDSERPEIVPGAASTPVTCLDIGRKLATLPGWNLVFQRKYSPSYSYEMRHPTIDRLIWFVARNMSNAANLTDFVWSGTGEWYGCGVVGIYGADIFSMLDGRAAAIGHRFTCNRFGRLRVRKDQNLIAEDLRDSGIHVILTESDYLNFQWGHSITPQFNSLWSSGIVTNQLDHDGAGFAVSALFCVAPGQVPIQGVQEMDQGEQVVSQREANRELKRREANRFENRLSPQDTGFTLSLCGGNDIGLDPAEMQLVTINLAAAYAAQRGQVFGSTQFYPLRVGIQYNHEGMYADVSIEAEKYNVASYDALSYTP